MISSPSASNSSRSPRSHVLRAITILTVVLIYHFGLNDPGIDLITALADSGFLAVVLAFIVVIGFWKWRRDVSEFFIVIGTVELYSLLLRHFLLATLQEHLAVTIDPALHQLDQFLGSPSNVWWSFLPSHRRLANLVILDYGAMALILPLIALLILSIRRDDESRTVFLALILCGVIAIPFYALFPAVGPRFASAPSSAPPNCMPSVHFSLAIITFYGLRKTVVGFCAGALHVFLTVIATLGLGLHYAVDLVAAIPYSFMVIAASEELRGLGWLRSRTRTERADGFAADGQ